MQHNGTICLETERLLLRPFMEQDAEDLFLILSDKEVNTFLPWFPVETLAQAKERLNKDYLIHGEQPAGYRYAICLKSDNKPIGYVSVNNGSNDFGYGLRKEFWHMGIVTEACVEVVKHLKQQGYAYITATHDIHNPRSGEVMKKIGMKYQYSYVEQWQPKNIPVTFRMYQLNFDGMEDRVYTAYWDKYDEHFIESDF